ncbi:MAG: DUF503 domain-containing protein [Desulfotomaculales bacterium]
MVVGVLTVELFIPGATSLKEKRRILKGMLEKIRSRFNVSAAEVGRQDAWQFSVLGVACVSNESSHAYQVLASVSRFIEDLRQAEVVGVRTEVF